MMLSRVDFRKAHEDACLVAYVTENNFYLPLKFNLLII